MKGSFISCTFVGRASLTVFLYVNLKDKCFDSVFGNLLWNK